MSVTTAVAAAAMSNNESKYLKSLSAAIDASALPKELIEIIASYVPPDFALRWEWLQPALATLPVATAHPMDTHARRRFAFAYGCSAGYTFPFYVDRGEPEPVSLDAVMSDLATHAVDYRKIVLHDARNDDCQQTLGGGTVADRRDAAIITQLALIRVEFDGLMRDWRVAFVQQSRSRYDEAFAVCVTEPHVAPAQALSIWLRTDDE